MTQTSSHELNRIRAEYARRDASGVGSMYQETNPVFLFHKQEREWELLSHLRAQNMELAGCRVLEVGCGTGHILQRFLDFGAAEAVGLDLMSPRLMTGRTSYPLIMLAQGNAAELPFRSGAFDLVMQFMCLSSVLDAPMRRQIAQEMWRVVRPGGLLLSYDLRPVSFSGRLLLKTFSLLERLAYGFTPQSERGAASTGPPTPIQPVTLSEVLELFPRCEAHSRSVSLNFHLARIACRSRIAASLMALIPSLRTHWLVTVHKPGRPESEPQP
jgi:ubiquinone/menaquinone biosynthesis C-methylase UbiE